MKIITAICITLISQCIFGQVDEKDIQKHAKRVAKSAEKHNGVESLDTFFYDGKPISKYIVKKRMMGTAMLFEFLSFTKNETLISGEYIVEGEGSATQYFRDLNFLGINKKIRLGQVIDIFDLLGDYAVMNDSALNVSNVERLFLEKSAPAVIVGAKPPVPVISPALADRNRSGIIMILEKNVRQSNVDIGTIAESTETVNGKMKKIYTVYYVDGTICAISKNENITGHDWSIVTQKDNRTTAIYSKIGQDSNDIIKWLVDNLYL